ANLHVEVRECYCVLVMQRLDAGCKTCKDVSRDVPQVINECSDPLGGEHLVYLRVGERFDGGVGVCLKLLLCNLKVLLERVALVDECPGAEHDSLDTALRPGLTLGYLRQALHGLLQCSSSKSILLLVECLGQVCLVVFTECLDELRQL